VPIVRLQRSGHTGAIGSKIQRRRILPRSRQRPRAVVEGSLTKNGNKTGVRLWTAPSFDQDCEIGRRDALNPIANQSNGTAGSNQRRGAIRSASHTCSNSRPHT
jgi:hypothetical protein